MKLKILFLFLLTICWLHAEGTYTDFLLIRHGQTDWNREDRLQGHTDVPLNSNGLSQAELLAEKMVSAHPDITSTVYSSDLTRAIVTAEKTMMAFQNQANRNLTLKQKESIREIHYGESEGLTNTEKNILYKEEEERLDSTYPNRKERWNFTSMPGAESNNALLERTKGALLQIAKEHPGEKVAVFAHGNLIHKLAIDSSGEDISKHKIPNCAVAHFRVFHDENQIQFIKIEDLLSN